MGVATSPFVKLTAFIILLLAMAKAFAGGEVIIDFRENETLAWRPVNDGVMGGLSKSAFRTTPQGTGLFEGKVSLENNGGFASVRAPIGDLDLSSFTGLAVRVRGDGQRYRLRLHMDDRFDSIAYQAKFQTTARVWKVVQLAFSGFVPTYRGRTLENIEPLDPGKIRQLGFMIADKQAGDFRLEIEWVQAY